MRTRIRARGVLVVLVGVVALVTSGCFVPEVPTTNASASLGTQFGRVNDWTSNLPFVDVMKASRPWFSGTATTWDDGRALDLDADGWVRSLQAGQVARTSILTRVTGYPAGDWVVRWSGEGTFRFARGQLTPAGDHRAVLRLTGAEGGTTLEITSIDPANPLRDLTLTMPGGVCRADGTVAVTGPADCPEGAYLAFEEHPDSIVFNPRFLAQVREFRSLRFTSWQGVNDLGNRGATGVWSQRRRPESATWWGEVPLEVMIDLANRVDADPWFNIPHLADDAYVTGFATMLRDRLDPSLDAWIEFSNEVWNPVFAQTTWAREQGVAAGLSTDPNLAMLRFYARRSVQVHDVVETVMGGTDRIQRVVATQAANSWSARQVLSFEGTADQVDVLAIAPYFGGEIGRHGDLDAVRASTPEQLLERLRTESVPTAITAMTQHKAIADEFGVRLDAYESGQHVTPPFGYETDAALTALFSAVNRHPQMGELYATYLQAWRDLDAGMMMTFVTVETPFGGSNWGMLETMAQEHSPKWDAVAAFNEANAPWWE